MAMKIGERDYYDLSSYPSYSDSLELVFLWL